jgi:pSer/pThr/pTyr-binding forkhead associated (FHA) protein
VANVTKLTISRGETKGKEFLLQNGDNLVGRWDPDYGSFPEVDLESHDPEAKVSRKHAVIRLKDSELTLEDLGSLNGTFVNRGPRLEPGKLVTLKDGDEVIVGKTFLTVSSTRSVV